VIFGGSTRSLWCAAYVWVCVLKPRVVKCLELLSNYAFYTRSYDSRHSCHTHILRFACISRHIYHVCIARIGCTVDSRYHHYYICLSVCCTPHPTDTVMCMMNIPAPVNGCHLMSITWTNNTHANPTLPHVYHT